MEYTNHDERPQRRVRKRSLRLQLESVLRSAQELDNEPTNDMSIARMKFLQARLNVLAQMQARERHDKLRIVKEQLIDRKSVV